MGNFECRREDRRTSRCLPAMGHSLRAPRASPSSKNKETRIVACSATWVRRHDDKSLTKEFSQSDTKSLVTKGRGGLFRRHNSSSSTGKVSSPQKSKEATSPRSDISPRSEGARPRPQPRKRSLDASREGSRLSIFGSTFVGTLGKARKPPPRYP
jgi:hypothetical protein